MGILDRIFGLSRKNKIRLIVLFILSILYIYIIWYPDIVRYRDFGINIPRGFAIHGIDVSHYQGDIVWHEVEKMQSHGMQLDFAFIKATEGRSLVDPKFKKNWRHIHRTRLLAGAYHFFRADVDPHEQASHFLRHARLKKGDLAAVLDVETMDGMSSEELRERSLVYLRHVENRTGATPIIYTNIDFFRRIFDHKSFRRYPLWIAHYTHSGAPRLDEDWVLWQHSESGRVNSIKGKVDFNVINGSMAQLEKLKIP